MTNPHASARDASWYNHPNARSFKTVHVATDDDMAICNARVPLGVLRWDDAADVPTGNRCRRRACASAYAAADLARQDALGRLRGGD